MENTKVYMALNCCLKITMPNLHKIGLKMRELCFKNLAPLRVGPRASLHYPTPPQENVPLGHIFSLLAMNGPLPAQAKIRENTEYIFFVLFPQASLPSMNFNISKMVYYILGLNFKLLCFKVIVIHYHTLIYTSCS